MLIERKILVAYLLKGNGKENNKETKWREKNMYVKTYLQDKPSSNTLEYDYARIIMLVIKKILSLCYFQMNTWNMRKW